MHAELSGPTLYLEFNLRQKNTPSLQLGVFVFWGTKSYLLKYKLRSEYSFWNMGSLSDSIK